MAFITLKTKEWECRQKLFQALADSKLLPKFDTVLRVLLKHGLTIDFPKDTQLNRSRDNFASCDLFEGQMLGHISNGLIAAYISLFCRNVATFEELPYDFFDRFSVSKASMLMRNENVCRNAEIINQGDALKDYSAYEKPQHLIDLMCFIKLIPYRETDDHPVTKMSLVDLAERHRSGQTLNRQYLPSQIQTQIDFTQSQKTNRSFFSQTVNELPKHPETGILWEPSENDPGNWRLFHYLCSYLIDLITDRKPSVAYSTQVKDAYAYVRYDLNTIHFNPVAVYQETQEIFSSNPTDSRSTVNLNFIVRLLEVLTHEILHLGESPCTGTHQCDFFIRQSLLIQSSVDKIDSHLLLQLYTQHYEEFSVADNSKSDVEFIKTALPLSHSSNSSLP